jgi:hypothetical protein
MIFFLRISKYSFNVTTFDWEYQLMVIFSLFVLKENKENTWIPQSNLEKVEFLAFFLKLFPNTPIIK